MSDAYSARVTPARFPEQLSLDGRLALLAMAPAGVRAAADFEEQLARFKALTGQAVDPGLRDAILQFAATMPIQAAVDKVAWDLIGGDRPTHA